MKSLEELVKDVERDLVINMVIGVRHGRLTLKESKNLSKNFMASFPFGDHESLFENLYNLSSEYKVARKTYVKYAPDFYDRKSQEQIKKVRENYANI